MVRIHAESQLPLIAQNISIGAVDQGPKSAFDRGLRTRILEKLAQRGIWPSADLSVEVDALGVRLAGRVPSYYQRQLIVHSASQVTGRDVIEDAIEVVSPDDARRSLCRTNARRFRFAITHGRGVHVIAH
jgi:osmotically-inducible protein OsmY